MPYPCRVKARFTHTMPRPCHEPAILLLLITNFLELRVVAKEADSWQVANIQFPRCSHDVSMPRLYHEPAVKGIFVAWQGNGMVCVNQTRPHCVNQMGKTQSKSLAVRHGRGTAGEWQGNGMVCVNPP